MSKHHQSHRRRSYGRRQHEIHERQVEPRTQPQADIDGLAGDDHEQAGVRFDVPRASHRLSFSVGD
jgi:hypothetical protein